MISGIVFVELPKIAGYIPGLTDITVKIGILLFVSGLILVIIGAIGIITAKHVES